MCATSSGTCAKVRTVAATANGTGNSVNRRVGRGDSNVAERVSDMDRRGLKPFGNPARPPRRNHSGELTHYSGPD